MSDSQTTTQSKSATFNNRLVTAALLTLIVLLGGYFRFMSMNWDDFAYLHPDERYLTLNLLPQIGGALELTPDNEHVPSHSILTLVGNQFIQSATDILVNETLVVGTIRNSLSSDVGDWWLGDTRTVAYENADNAHQALLSGEVDAIILPEIESQRFISASIGTLSVLDSVRIQQLRCTDRNPNTNSIGGYFDTDCSPLNPHNATSGSYAYGTLPLFISHFASNLLQELDAPESPVSDLVSFQSYALVWRFFSAFFDVGAIIFIFLIGSRLHNRWVGLMAAVLYACAPLAIQKAHFGTVNSITAFFVTMAIWAAVNVQDKGKIRYYILFGIAFGAALAGRINIVPLAGVVVLAGMVNAAPVLDKRIAWSERQRLLWRNVIGVFIAGFTSVIAFRIFNPYAFTGPTFFHMIPNLRWLADAQGSSFAVSGASDAPPNYQWLGRISYLYPLRDMLFWGMGITMGVMAWLGFTWSGYRLARGRQFSTRNILIFAWVFVYFAWIGDLWVMTMRYYLPLYSSLALFAAWAVYELYRQSREQDRDTGLVRVLLISFAVFFALIPIVQINTALLTATGITSGIVALVLFVLAIVPKIKFRAVALGSFVVGFTVLWGLMFSNIYQHESNRVQAARWASEYISGDFSMQVEGAPENTPLINIGIFNRTGNSATEPSGMIDTVSRLEPALPYLVDFVAPATGTISTIHAPHIGDPLDSPENEILYLSIADVNTAQLLAEITLEDNFTRRNHPLGDSYDITLETPIDVVEGERYTFKVEALEGTITTSGEVMLTEGTWDDRITTINYCTLPNGLTSADDPAPGLVSAQTCNGSILARSLFHSYDLIMSYPVDEQIKHDSIVDGLEVGDYLAITSNRFYDTEPRNPMRFPLTTTYYDALFDGELGYELVATFSESYAFAGLSVNDQHLPIYDSPAWFNELEADEAFHVYDHPAVFIFRKTEDYDHANTELILDVPLERVERIGLGSNQQGADVVGVIYNPSLEADDAPTALHQPQDILEANTSGGTWSERFDSDSILNSSQPIGVVVWWLTIVVIGLVTFPILFTAFPNLADKGYGFAKIIGMLLIGWVAWMGASFKVPMWSQAGLIVLLLLLTAFSMYLSYVRREDIIHYLREHWGRLLGIELITLVLFLIMLGIRLSNPDLWHHPMGGEKPMDFAYFNATLRTTVFPAYDPWYAGGYINYYYFGYVIVGVPTLLLKIVPAFAYNLIVPTIFATAGIGAFSAAFNIVASWSTRRVESYDGEKVTIIRRMGNPWVAGFAAMLLAVVLGNLDTPRVLIEEGIAPLGGYTRPTGLEGFLVNQYIEQNGIAPTGADLIDIQERAAQGYLTDELVYEVGIRLDLLSSVVRGLGRAVTGETLPVGSNRWYWAPTRVIDETPGVGGNAITEMPAFTFIYGDLHAHMINMPLMLFAIAFVFYEVSLGKRDERNLLAQFLALFLGALAIGMMRATNTWDWPSFMLFAIVGLGFAWWRRWQDSFDTRVIVRSMIFIIPATIFTVLMGLWLYASFSVPVGDINFLIRLVSNLPMRGALMIVAISGASLVFWHLAPLVTDGIHRQALLHMLFFVGGFITLATFVIAPYNGWYASIYSSVSPWTGNQTPLWAYWNIHGLFIFLITSLLIWDTSRWLREVYVRDLRGQQLWLMVGASIVGVLLLAALIGYVMGYQVAIIVVPLVIWIALLFFRPNQSVAMQYVLVLAGFALALTLGVEIIVIAGDIGRQNTVFKFYIQAWFFFSIAGGVAFAWLIQHADLWRFRTQLLWFTPLMFMVAAAAMFPFAATRARTVDRFVPTLPMTLNGLDYMEETDYYLPYTGVVIPLENDYHIIRWLQENVEGTPVMMEGRSIVSEYHYNGRIAINTGLPTILGWNWHQRQQRTLEPLGRIVQQREANIRYFYESNDIPSVVNLMRYYNMGYIVVSDMEIAIFPDGIEKFNRMVEVGILEIAYQHGVGLVYQVNQDEADDFMRNQMVFNEAVGLDENLLPPYVPSTAVVGYSANPNVDVSEALAVLNEYDMQYVVLTNPPRLITNQAPVYDRFLRLEDLGVLLRIDDNEARRTYRVNQDVVELLLNEEN